MITELLSRFFALFTSDDTIRARFEAEPEAVLAEAGLGECSVAELADALPLAVADLPPAQATLILDRCGPSETWVGQTVTTVLCRVVEEPKPTTWADQPAEVVVEAPPAAEQPVVVDPPVEAPPAVEEPVVEHPPAVEEPPVVEHPPVAANPPVVEEPPVVEPPVVEEPVVEQPPVAEEPPVVEHPPVVDEPVAEDPHVVVDPPVVEQPPVAEHPPVEEPPVEEPPVVEPPVVEPPVVEHPPVVDEPVVEDPHVVVDPPVVEQPPVAEQPPVVDEPVAEQPPVVETPPAIEEPPVAEEQPPVDEKPPAVEEPPVVDEPVAEQPPVVDEEPPVAEEPPAVDEEPPADDKPPAGEVLIPPDAGRDFLDFKSAVRAAREAIAADDPDALSAAIRSAEPDAREDIASSLRGELLASGVAPDDPLIGALDVEIVAAGGAVPGVDGADDAGGTDGDTPADGAGDGSFTDVGLPIPDGGSLNDAIDQIEDRLADGIDLNAGADTGADAGAGAASAAEFDAAAAAERVGSLITNGDFDGAADLLGRLTPEQRQAVQDAIPGLGEERIDPVTANILDGADLTGADLDAALKDSREAFIERVDQQRAEAEAAAAEEAAAEEANSANGANGDDGKISKPRGTEADIVNPLAPQPGQDDGLTKVGDENSAAAPEIPSTSIAPEPTGPAVGDGTSNTVAVDEQPRAVVGIDKVRAADGSVKEVTTEPTDADLDFGAGATGPSAGGAAPTIPDTPPSEDLLPPAPDAVADDPAAADPGDALVGGEDFFGGEASGGVIPLDPAGEPDPADAVPDAEVGGEDFFGIDPTPGGGQDDGQDGGFLLTPEEIAELAAIDAEAADAIIDNIGG